MVRTARAADITFRVVVIQVCDGGTTFLHGPTKSGCERWSCASANDPSQWKYLCVSRICSIMRFTLQVLFFSLNSITATARLRWRTLPYRCCQPDKFWGVELRRSLRMVLRLGSPELGANVNDSSQFPTDVSMRHSHLFVHEFGSARYSVDYTCTLTEEDVAVLMFSAADVHEELSYEGFFALCCHQTLCRVSLPMPHKECPVGHSVIVPA